MQSGGGKVLGRVRRGMGVLPGLIGKPRGLSSRPSAIGLRKDAVYLSGANLAPDSRIAYKLA
jgi:hypothetical protein